MSDNNGVVSGPAEPGMSGLLAEVEALLSKPEATAEERATLLLKVKAAKPGRPRQLLQLTVECDVTETGLSGAEPEAEALEKLAIEEATKAAQRVVDAYAVKVKGLPDERLVAVLRRGAESG